MIEMFVTEQMLESATLRARDLGRLKNSITQGDGSLAGFIGEVAVAHHLNAIHDNTYDYDLIHGDVTIDVKTKRTTVAPAANHECSVADFNTTQKCSWYCFTRVNVESRRVWILGYMPKDEFYQKATFHRAGEVDPDNNFTFKADCYNISIGQLYSLDGTTPTIELPPEAGAGPDDAYAGYDWLYGLQVRSA